MKEQYEQASPETPSPEQAMTGSGKAKNILQEIIELLQKLFSKGSNNKFFDFGKAEMEEVGNKTPEQEAGCRMKQAAQRMEGHAAEFDDLTEATKDLLANSLITTDMVNKLTEALDKKNGLELEEMERLADQLDSLEDRVGRIGKTDSVLQFLEQLEWTDIEGGKAPIDSYKMFKDGDNLILFSAAIDELQNKVRPGAEIAPALIVINKDLQSIESYRTLADSPKAKDIRVDQEFTEGARAGITYVRELCQEQNQRICDAKEAINRSLSDELDKRSEKQGINSKKQGINSAKEKGKTSVTPQEAMQGWVSTLEGALYKMALGENAIVSPHVESNPQKGLISIEYTEDQQHHKLVFKANADGLSLMSYVDGNRDATLLDMQVQFDGDRILARDNIACARLMQNLPKEVMQNVVPVEEAAKPFKNMAQETRKFLQRSYDATERKNAQHGRFPNPFKQHAIKDETVEINFSRD